MSPARPKPKDIAVFVQAAIINDLKLLQRGLDAGIPVDARDKEGDTALMTATYFGSRKAFDWLLAHGADARAVNKEGKSCLAFAISGGDAGMVEALVSHGADVNAPIGKESQTPLHWCANFRSNKVPELLIRLGADLNQRASDGETPLTLAIRKGNVPIAEMLIKSGADVNVANDAGDTAIDLVRSGRFLDENGQKKLVKQLLAAGARGGETGEIKQQLAEAAKAGESARINGLIAAGAPADVADLQGYTPLMYAAENGHAEAFFTLVKAGANLHAIVGDRDNGTDVLEATANGGNVEIVRFLLKRRLPVEGHAKFGTGLVSRIAGHATPLICAAMNGHADVVRVLLEAGANVKAKLGGLTALQLAKGEGHKEVAALLRKGGAAEPGEDPAVIEVGRFGQTAATPSYQKIVQLLTDLCGRPKNWKPRQDQGIKAPGVHRFTVKRTHSLAARYGEGEERELIWKLMAEVRQAGFQIIVEDFFEGPDNLVLFPTSDYFAVIAAVGTNGANYGIDTGDIVDWLRETAAKDPFVLTGCGHDFVAGDFLRPLSDAKGLAKRMVEFCPDSLDGDEFDTPAKLARALKESQEFYLWWD